MNKKNKTYDYIVELKQKSTKHITLIGLLLLAFVYLMYFYNVLQKQKNFFERVNDYLTIAMGICSLIALAISYLKFKSEGKFYLFWPLALSAMLWFSIDKLQWIFLLYIIVAYLDKPLKITAEYGFDDEGIILNSFPEKKYNWSEVSNVVLRFGMLSIDFYNNRIIQSEINDDISIEIEKEFNVFCKQQIKLNKTV